MNGLELARAYYRAYGDALFAGLPASVRASAAVGLVGAGSECLGFDDELSRDHDFGPGFCVWLPAEAYAAWGPELQRRYDALPSAFNGVRRVSTPLSGQRVGVFETGAFYRTFTGLAGVPATSKEWLAVPEWLLATATNGEVFCDPLGAFTAVRQGLLGFYPEAVVRKKVAAYVAAMAQAGQYNLVRARARGDAGAANAARAEFLMAFVSALHLLGRVYRPFHKWAFRSLRERVPGGAAAALLAGRIAAPSVLEVAQADVEGACIVVAAALRALGWAATGSDFLLDAAQEVQAGLTDPYLAGLPLSAGAFL